MVQTQNSDPQHVFVLTGSADTGTGQTFFGELTRAPVELHKYGKQFCPGKKQ